MKVYLIARSQLDLSVIKQFLRDEQVGWRQTEGASSAEELVEFSGRICYMSFSESQSPRANSEYLANLIQMGHESVLEHISWTFVITGVSRAFTHQLVRHRVGFAFSQLSQQYHDETEAKFIEPAHLADYPEAHRAWTAATKTAKASYEEILRVLATAETKTGSLHGRELRRAIRSSARSVLPNATESKIVVTANARAVRYFLKVRGSIPGDLEMREVAAALLSAVSSEAPSLFSDFKIEQWPDGPVVIQEKPQSQTEPGATPKP